MKKRIKKKPNLGVKKGGIQYAILALVIILGVVFTGSLFVNTKTLNPTYTSYPAALAQCCNTGDGEQCRPETGEGKELTFQGQRYGLLRSNTKFVEGNVHLRDSGAPPTTQGPIVVNDSDKYDYALATHPGIDPVCSTGNRDKYFNKAILKEDVPRIDINPYCTAIPNDQMIFVCRENCFSSVCVPPPGKEFEGNPTCYGDDNSVYDIYFRIADYESTGIPEFVKNCDKSLIPSPDPSTATGSGQRIVFNPAESDQDNLQLDHFIIEEEFGSIQVPWVSPWCKPAVYLYPETATNVHVQVFPKGPMTYTDPLYPATGWHVMAQPDGTITFQNKVYDYLYYEAEIPDKLIREPKEGYVAEYDKLGTLFDELMPKLGLNEKESVQFKEYWLKTLPRAPYYSVKIIPVTNLNEIAPLEIAPEPNRILRVTLQFKPLDKKIALPEPLILPFTRSGFTVVEWGGIFKKQGKYEFSCFM